ELRRTDEVLRKAAGGPVVGRSESIRSAETGRCGEARGICAAGGLVGIVNAAGGTKNRLRVPAICHSEARTETQSPRLVELFSDAAGAAAAKYQRAVNAHWILRTGAEGTELAMDFVERRSIVPAEAVRQRQFGGDSPVVLREERVGVGTEAGGALQRGARGAYFAQQETGEGTAPVGQARGV